MKFSMLSCTPQFNITFPSDSKALRTIVRVIFPASYEPAFAVTSSGTY